MMHGQLQHGVYLLGFIMISQEPVGLVGGGFCKRVIF